MWPVFLCTHFVPLSSFSASFSGLGYVSCPPLWNEAFCSSDGIWRLHVLLFLIRVAVVTSSWLRKDAGNVSWRSWLPWPDHFSLQNAYLRAEIGGWNKLLRGLTISERKPPVLQHWATQLLNQSSICSARELRNVLAMLERAFVLLRQLFFLQLMAAI